MKFTIDRFEGEFAVIELADGKTAQVPKIALPFEAKEGDIISLKVETYETIKRKEILENKIANLFKD